MSNFLLTFKSFGENAVLIEWPKEIDETILKDVLHFKSKIEASLGTDVKEVRSAYQSLLVVYDRAINHTKCIPRLKQIYGENFGSKLTMCSKLWRIPVCYEDCFGIDLERIAKLNNLSKEAIIHLHAKPVYTVFFLGFLPGFLYLGGLDAKLHTPRNAQPRLHVEKGAVAIGGKQTGVYPNKSPGGWNIIGNTPITFFSPKSKAPCFASAGDRIQFYPVLFEEYSKIKELVETDAFSLENEVWNG
ncbi:5-oxoprolinase subunit PxpB [Cognatitamlana onchidii]|uniref:5-oxoprolinase subunit PxpB n=1 Tax=Cognatitamlana onchidii TaxID=2562860 RepID=UPI0010A65420|nr:5-oxoprolinase subunit PxpB [Algibacter onchidii]